jgi:D-alanyl-lipoteichoic acid acyltransferase DltB (MBOAT superfamily)
MVFSSSTFIFLFLPIVLVGYYLLHPRYRNVFLLLASLSFYAFGEPKFVLLLIASIVFNYLVALVIGGCKRKGIRRLCLMIGVTCDLLLLIIYKYMNFITQNLQRSFPFVSVTSFALPIGISFFTFQAISYLADVYRGEDIQKNPLDLGLYISFFPQLVAGPIVRYKTISAELINRKSTWADFSSGVVSFINGLIKKIVIANNLAIIADLSFTGDIRHHSILFAWLGALAFTLQIYFDFSGYSDMAIGLGRMFGFHFSKNFDYPYSANSVTDFWRRWHISLSTWFRDYVYIPLGGSRKGAWRQIINLLIVWLLTGIWHGAAWTFVLWGLAYFFLLLLEKFLIKPDRLRNKAVSWLYRVFVFFSVMICWVVFRADSIRDAGRYVKSMLGLYGNPLVDNDWLFYSREYMVIFALAILLATPVVRYVLRRFKSKMKPVCYETIRAAGYIFMFIVSISYLILGAHNPFIYFNF